MPNDTANNRSENKIALIFDQLPVLHWNILILSCSCLTGLFFKIISGCKTKNIKKYTAANKLMRWRCSDAAMLFGARYNGYVYCVQGFVENSL